MPCNPKYPGFSPAGGVSPRQADRVGDHGAHAAAFERGPILKRRGLVYIYIYIYLYLSLSIYVEIGVEPSCCHNFLQYLPLAVGRLQQPALGVQFDEGQLSMDQVMYY